MEPETTTPAPWNPWPVSIIAFFVLALLGCATFVAYCNRHPADLVAQDYYEQEVRYQGQLDGLQRAQQGATLASVSFDSSRKCIRVCLPPNPAGASPKGSIQLYRPSSVKMDRHIELGTDASGVQLINAAGLLPGLWRVQVSWTVDHQDYRIDQRVVVGS